MPKLFVYGTLKKGHGNHMYLRDAQLLSNDAWIKRTELVDCGFFPGLRLGRGDTAVLGELYKIDNATLRAIDRLEGHPNLFKRIEMEVHRRGDVSTRAFVYEIQDYLTYRLMDDVDGEYKW